MHDDDDGDDYKDNERISDDRGCSLRGVLLFRVCDVLFFQSEVGGSLGMFSLFLRIRQVGWLPLWGAIDRSCLDASQRCCTVPSVYLGADMG